MKFIRQSSQQQNDASNTKRYKNTQNTKKSFKNTSTSSRSISKELSA